MAPQGRQGRPLLRRPLTPPDPVEGQSVEGHRNADPSAMMMMMTSSPGGGGATWRRTRDAIPALRPDVVQDGNRIPRNLKRIQDLPSAVAAAAPRRRSSSSSSSSAVPLIGGEEFPRSYSTVPSSIRVVVEGEGEVRIGRKIERVGRAGIIDHVTSETLIRELNGRQKGFGRGVQPRLTLRWPLARIRLETNEHTAIKGTPKGDPVTRRSD